MIYLVYGQHYRDKRIPECYFLLQHTLLHAGVSAALSSDMVMGAKNIMVEGFTDENIETLTPLLQDTNTELYLIATEFLTGDSFNQFERDENNKSHYEIPEYWQNRYDNFCRVIEFCSGIMHLSEQQVGVYQAQFPDIPVAYLPHSYIPSMAMPFPCPPEKDIDVVFTGVLTRYRLEILEQLEAAGLVVEKCTTTTPAYIREDLTRRAKVALNLKQKASWLHPSNSRMHFHLLNQSCMVTEETPIKCDLSSLIIETPLQDLLTTVQELIQSERYITIAQEQHTAFKQQCHVDQNAGAVLAFFNFA
ncbi:CgeB family protein [Marinomonas atlantica]|uniref:hypothetical protein n=1 Tax=Marinomonas atlantica TaxID=1806668 RepID=UPI00082CE80C|nr:hypothetical protein [Marinomonas atlantica]